MLPLQLSTGANGDVATHLPAYIQVGTKGLQHAFAVIAGVCRLNHRAGSIRRQCGEQQGGFHLCTGDGGADNGTAQLASLHSQGSEVALPASAHVGSHHRERLPNALHGSPFEGIIPAQHKMSAIPSRQ